MYPTKKYPHTERFQPPILSIPKMHSNNKNYSIFYIGFVYSNCSEPLNSCNCSAQPCNPSRSTRSTSTTRS